MSEQKVATNTEFPANAGTNTSQRKIELFAIVSQKQLAIQDLKDGLLRWRTWLMLAYQDIKIRYRRSILGPFWITISMAVTVYSMGFLYAHLFHSEIRQYYPFLVAGMLTWSLIAACLTDLTDTFVVADGIRQIKLPYTIYIHRTISRNFIIFCHNILVMLPIFIIFSDTVKINANSLLLIPGLALIYLNAFIYGIILAMIGARYRDISQIIKSLIQVIFFITPIMWNPGTLSQKYQYFVNLNPIYSIVELVRAPLLGMTPSLLNWLYVSALTIVGACICSAMFSRYRSRIIYWI